MTHTRFGRNSTIRLSCRAGDFLQWCGHMGIYSDQYKTNAIWQLKDGDFVTITNRHVDLPLWFDLHPLETSGSLAYRLYGASMSANQLGETVDGPNIWRALTGDRLVWVGKKRPGVEFNDGVLSVFSFNENAIIIGESVSDHDVFSNFGGFDQQEQSQEDKILCSNGLKAVSGLGGPRSISADGRWTIRD